MGRDHVFYFFSWVIQSPYSGWLENGACQDVKNIGKPCAGELHARFDEEGQA
jgi:predicted transport protein